MPDFTSSSMPIVVDTHVHLYPVYNLSEAFSCADRNLSILSAEAFPGNPDTEQVLCLTERSDCRVFEELSRGSEFQRVGRWSVVPSGEAEGLWLKCSGGRKILLVAGRQITSAERIELLALGRDLRIEDGIPIRGVIDRVESAGALPVLPWSPGKWFFRRGEIVRDLIESEPETRILLGEIPMRPTLWGEPKLLQLARRQRRPVLAGSDPLPFSGEEERIGTFALASCERIAETAPVSSLLHALRFGSWRIVGRRNTIFECLIRLQKNAAVRRRGVETSLAFW